jgi:predicted phage terminase large subunit-like protein
MADFVFDAANEPRLLLGARRYGKSEYSVILKAAQEIALNKTRILLIIRDKERAKDFALEIARCVKALGISDFSRINSSVIQLASNTTKEPNLSAVVLGSKGIRSRHPDIVILDDPITPETASPADKKKAKRVYDEVLKLTQRVRIIGQPVSKADLYDITRQKIKTLEMPHGSIPELDTDLELLRLAGVDEASINASYFLKLTDVGKMPFSDIEIIDVSFDKAKGAIASIDPSHEGGDFTAISICQGHFDKLLIAGFCFKAAWYDCINELSALFAKYNVSICFFENNALGEEPIRQLKKIAPAVRVSGFKSLDNKEAKIQNAGMFAKEIIVSKESNTEYIEQLKNYEAGIEHDDAPDSLANLFINLRLQKSAKEKRLF